MPTSVEYPMRTAHPSARAARHANSLPAIAHDLKSPLTSILGYAELLRSGAAGALTDQQDEMVGTLERNANRLLALSEQLLEDEPQLVPETIDLFALFRDLSVALLPSAAAAGVSIDVTIDDDLTTIQGDATQLSRVFTNVIGNAVKFSGPDSRVKVRVRHLADAIRITIVDMGAGIPAAELQSVFQPYQRASNVGRTQGTGLGLSIAREIVERHGGVIMLASSVGIGTTVTVDLPEHADRFWLTD